MTTGDLSADAPATDLFPQFGDQLYEMISSEVHGLTDEQLDFETDRWEWSKWSIRRNLSHMASGDMRWLWLRWGTELFPGGLPAGLDIDAIIESPNDRRLDESRYWAPGRYSRRAAPGVGFRPQRTFRGDCGLDAKPGNRYRGRRSF